MKTAPEQALGLNMMSVPEPAMGSQLYKTSVFGQLVRERELGRMMALELVQGKQPEVGPERGLNKTLMPG